MACVSFNTRNPAFYEWENLTDEELIRFYKSQTAKPVHASGVGLAVVDYVTLDFSYRKNQGYRYAYNAERLRTWIERFENDGNGLIDADGTTIVDTYLYDFYGELNGFKIEDKIWGPEFGMHGCTVQLYTTNNKTYGVKDNWYPFNHGLSTTFLHYFDTHNDYLGDAFELGSIIYDEFEDGVEGGWYTGNQFEMFFSFGDIVSLKKGTYIWEFNIRGYKEPFYAYNLTHAGAAKAGLPFPRGGDTNGYIPDSFYLRDVGPDKRLVQNNTIFFNEEFDWDEFTDVIEAVASGTTVYNTRRIQSGKQAARRAALSQRPLYQKRQARRAQ